jgi:ADP-ribose pyrophosphatase
VSDAPEEVMWAGKYLAARRRGPWEYATRQGDGRAAVLLAIDDEDHVLLVDQYRVPLGRRSLELPAGLVGDEVAGEGIEAAAARELEEETGHRAARLDIVGDFASSPGMTSETFTLVRAVGLTRVGGGGGVAGEGITVHRVPVGAVSDYVAARRAEGFAIDVRILVLLGGLFLSDTPVRPE